MPRVARDLSSLILSLLAEHPRDLVKIVAQRAAVTRQTASSHIRKLEREGWIHSSGTTHKTYLPGEKRCRVISRPISTALDESQLWAEEFSAYTADFSANVRRILEHGFTEMVNNVRDHSGGTKLTCIYLASRQSVALTIIDNGEGIFRRIRRLCGLADERLALLELAKGKLTTDPKNHSGEGIFFTSRAFDHFVIASGELTFSHSPESDWLQEQDDIVSEAAEKSGTTVWMMLDKNTETELQHVFDRFAAPEEYSFSKTIVPLRMARLGAENLVSRSQAKRALSRVDRFKTVLFDFTAVDTVGQAFADEIFRVFANAHPEMQLIPIHFNAAVKRMLLHVGLKPQQLNHPETES